MPKKSLLDKLERELRSLEEEEQKRIIIPNDPIKFCIKLLRFKPTPYQEAFLKDNSKRILLCWSRQSGKSHSIAARALWFALTHPKTLTLIVAPSLRQSMILNDKIRDHLANIPLEIRKQLIEKQQRTVIKFRNGSRIVALPCSENLLRGFTAHVVIADEANFFQHDKDIFYSILMPMLSTTDGWLIVSSTPWNRDSVFYRFYNDPKFSKHIVTWRDAVEAGLMKQDFIEQMRTLLPAERFQREFEAKFVEDSDAWLPQSLIVKCIDSMLTPYAFTDSPSGVFYVGVDFGKHQDYSVAAVAEREDDIIKIVHVHRFPLETEYASVIGYVKSLCDRWRTIKAVYADVTGVGDYIVEDMRKSGIPSVQGILFTVKSKEEMATILKETMRNGRLKIPYTPAKSIRDIDLTAELNAERFELTKTGHIKFSHPENTHDDVFWAVTLAVYAASRSAGALEVSTGRVWR
ncbi:terminase family protein [Candidatus Bathyarchaeota archaeon]|nr:terminase family protein [Candidatus Bathyarchaeota archaeon]